MSRPIVDVKSCGNQALMYNGAVFAQTLHIRHHTINPPKITSNTHMANAVEEAAESEGIIRIRSLV